MVVATTLAAAKIRKRSKAGCVRADSGTGERSAASMARAAVYCGPQATD
jgi:hypothetical protein